MFKFISNLIYLLISLITLEYVQYNKDYNEILIMNNYINYEITRGNTDLFIDNKYKVEIYFVNNKYEYKITSKRKSLFNIKAIKKIEYNGIVE